jgi:hypothetical protein
LSTSPKYVPGTGKDILRTRLLRAEVFRQTGKLEEAYAVNAELAFAEACELVRDTGTLILKNYGSLLGAADIRKFTPA